MAPVSLDGFLFVRKICRWNESKKTHTIRIHTFIFIYLLNLFFLLVEFSTNTMSLRMGFLSMFNQFLSFSLSVLAAFILPRFFVRIIHAKFLVFTLNFWLYSFLKSACLLTEIILQISLCFFSVFSN